MGRVARKADSFIQYITLLFRALGSPTSCWLAKSAVLISIIIALSPDGIAADDIPPWAQAVVILLGMIGALVVVPADFRGNHLKAPGQARACVERPTALQHIRFTIRIVRSDLANFFLYQYRGVDAFLVTGKNSGTHWLKFMLSCALAKQYHLPRPRHASGHDADEIIGDPRRPRANPHLPRIGSSHTIPSALCGWRWFTRLLPYPPVVVLVRDIESAMASHYVKWRHQMVGPLSSYVRGDPSGRRFKADIWWYVRFFNRWGDLARARPDKVLIVRYDDLRADPEACLRRIAAHWRLRLDAAAFAEALRFVRRDTIRSLLDPTGNETIVPPDNATASVIYSRADKAFLRGVMARYLRHDFGYGYNGAGHGEQDAAALSGGTATRAASPRA